MHYLTDDQSGVLTTQITRLLRDESTDNIPLLLEIVEGGGVNRRIIGYLFGIAVFHPVKQVAARALKLLQKHAGADTVRQAEKLKEGATYHYNEAEYLGKYRNPEFDIFDFILANKMCLWHRAGNNRSPFFEISHRTLNLIHYPENIISPAISTLDFVQYITLPGHKGFDLEATLPHLLALPLESVLVENLRLETFPTALFALPRLKSLTIRRGTHRPKNPMTVDPAKGPFYSNSLEKISIDAYTIENESLLGPFPALTSVEITRCHLKSFDFLQQSTKLSHLNLRGNQLITLPAFLGNLTQLRWIDLSQNPFKKIDIDLSDLYQLEHFEIKL